MNPHSKLFKDCNKPEKDPIELVDYVAFMMFVIGLGVILWLPPQ